MFQKLLYIKTDELPDPSSRQVRSDMHDLSHPFDDIARHDQIDFETARLRHARLLDDLNEDIARDIAGGGLVAVPLCPTACEPGPLAEFLLMLQCDPFGPINMRYAAKTSQTAEALETDEFTPERAMRYDAELLGFYSRARAAWDDFKLISPDATTIDVLNHRDTLRAVISQAAERLDDRDDSGKKHLWRDMIAAQVQKVA